MHKEPYTVIRKTMPLIPLRGMGVFPYMVVHFDVGREKSINALEKAMVNESIIFLCTQKDAKVDDPTVEEFYHIGTVCKIRQMLRLPGGSIRVLVEGLNRGKIVNMTKEDDYFEAEIDEYTYDAEKIVIDNEMKAIMRLVIDDFEEYLRLNSRISSDALLTVMDIDDPSRLADIVASYISFNLETHQQILETFDFYERLEVLHKILVEEIEILKIEEKINQRVRTQISKLQKEYFLKEQLRAIQRELGEDDDIDSEVEEYKAKIEKANMPKEAKEKALKEVERLNRMSPHSAETAVIRTYLGLVGGSSMG